MNTLSFSFTHISTEMEDILTAELGEAGFTGFEQEEGRFTAFIPEGVFDESRFAEIMERYQLQPERDAIPGQNWNALWESNFEPVRVGGFCGIRAHFHPPFTGVTHEIVITPKMSFGTGHHATTWMMMEAMEHLPMAGLSVCDFGTGTGLLAILAEKLGASAITAVDYDDWSVTNAAENIMENGCQRIDLLQADTLPSGHFDVILANINLHVLLPAVPAFARAFASGGCLLLSGILEEDVPTMTAALVPAGFTVRHTAVKGKWACMLLARN